MFTSLVPHWSFGDDHSLRSEMEGYSENFRLETSELLCDVYVCVSVNVYVWVYVSVNGKTKVFTKVVSVNQMFIPRILDFDSQTGVLLWIVCVWNIVINRVFVKYYITDYRVIYRKVIFNNFILVTYSSVIYRCYNVDQQVRFFFLRNRKRCSFDNRKNKRDEVLSKV